MSQINSVNDLLQRVKAGDGSAAATLVQRFSDQLTRLVQGRLNWKVRRHVDPEDIVQSALGSFFRMHAQNDLQFENWNALWGLLSLLTIRKCGHRIEYFQAACRNVNLEDSVLMRSDDSGQFHAAWEAVSHEPTPAQAVLLEELLNEILSPLDERDRQIVTLSLQGETVEQISATIRRSERTVQRVLSRLQDELLRRCSVSPAANTSEQC